MRFQILGPLQVSTDAGAPVTVPENKVRALLLRLLVAAGAPVTVDQLTEHLWPTRAPANPLAALHTKVWQLRRTLADAEPGAEDLLASTQNGYRLRTDQADVDVDRFEQLVRQARATSSPQERRALLEEGLALWRGQPLTDVADELYARPLVARLDELRLTAAEERAEALLELGEHTMLVADLSGLLEEHPLRERARSAHLRALYRSGRHAEALRSYQDLRTRLAGELGLDPSPELVALHQAVLEQNATLDPAPSSSTLLRAPSPSNLPVETSPLIGRDGATTHVRALIETSRLVTLTGIGGVGKTRIALAAAAELADRHVDGAWLVELATLESGGEVSFEAVVELVAENLDVRDETTPGLLRGTHGTPLVDRLVDALRTKQLLLVLDNCEHLVEHVARLVHRLLKGAPGLFILATSQERLGVDGERLWTVPPLSLPSGELRVTGSGPDDDLPGAVQLFVARAVAAAPEFVLDASNAAAVHEICARLDGIPLAIELAAARVRALGIAEVASRLGDRFDLLTVAPRHVPSRQRTLRATIDWSWNLLGERERQVLRRMSVHSGGFTLAAAEAVGVGLDVRRGDVVDVLSRLVDRSLVTAAPTSEGHRYSMVESVAAYSQHQLVEAGEESTTRTAHLRFHVEQARRAVAHLRGPQQRRWLALLGVETANVRHALDFAVRAELAEEALALVNAMSWFWFLRGRLTEALRSLALALSAPGAIDAPDARTTARAWAAGLRLGTTGDRAESLRECDDVLRHSAEVHSRPQRAATAWFLGFSSIGFGNQAVNSARLGTVLAEYRELGDEWGTAAASAALAAQALLTGDLEEVERRGQEGSALFEQTRDGWGRMYAMDSLAALAEVRGDYTRAVSLHTDGLRIAEELGLWNEASIKLSGLGRIALLRGEHDEARTLHERAMRMAAEQGYTFGEQFAEVGLGLGARRAGDLDAAERHLRRWLEWCRQWEGGNGTALILAELGLVAARRGDVEDAERLQREGYEAALGTKDPRSIALSLEGLADAHATAGRHERAARLLGMAARTRVMAGAPLPPGESTDVERTARRSRVALGEDLFEASFDDGRDRPDQEHELVYAAS